MLEQLPRMVHARPYPRGGRIAVTGEERDEPVAPDDVAPELVTSITLVVPAAVQHVSAQPSHVPMIPPPFSPLVLYVSCVDNP